MIKNAVNVLCDAERFCIAEYDCVVPSVKVLENIFPLNYLM